MIISYMLHGNTEHEHVGGVCRKQFHACSVQGHISRNGHRSRPSTEQREPEGHLHAAPVFSATDWIYSL